MKKEENIEVQIEYGEGDLKELLIEILKEQYIEYMAGSDEFKNE